MLSTSLWREHQEEHTSEIYKISSILEGWVIEIDEKNAKYRGEHLTRKKLLTHVIDFYIKFTDRIKGSLI